MVTILPELFPGLYFSENKRNKNEVDQYIHEHAQGNFRAQEPLYIEQEKRKENGYIIANKRKKEGNTANNNADHRAYDQVSGHITER